MVSSIPSGWLQNWLQQTEPKISIYQRCAFAEAVAGSWDGIDQRPKSQGWRAFKAGSRRVMLRGPRYRPDASSLEAEPFVPRRQSDHRSRRVEARQLLAQQEAIVREGLVGSQSVTRKLIEEFVRRSPAQTTNPADAPSPTASSWRMRRASYDWGPPDIERPGSESACRRTSSTARWMAGG